MAWRATLTQIAELRPIGREMLGEYPSSGRSWVGTAIKVTDGSAEVVSEGHRKLSSR
jgi:hypothetical protein